MSRIAVLHHGSPCSPALARLRAALAIRGLGEGNRCVVDAVGAQGRWNRLPELATQLIHRQPEVLVAIGALAALSAQHATSSVPIVHGIVLDPSDIGLTAANVTGVSTFDTNQAFRHLRLLQQLVPGLRRVAFLTDIDAPQGPGGHNPLVSRLLAAAAQLGLELRGAALSGIDSNLDQAFDTVQRIGPQALVALEVPSVLARLGEILELAERHRLPTLSPFGGSSSGLVMEGASLYDAIDPLADSVARVIRGRSVGAVPLKFIRHPRLVVCMDRVRRIDLAISTALLQQASLCVDDAATRSE
jgi:putative ABC transport system substrate-binding protein